MKKATAIVHASPRIGARFLQYTAEFETGGELGITRQQRFIYVLEGSIRLEELKKTLKRGQYIYCAAYQAERGLALEPSRAIVIEKALDHLPPHLPAETFCGSIHKIAPQPLMGDPAVQVRMLIPDHPQFGLAINSMTFEPGASLPMVESHVMEHGLMMIAGGGIYRLGDCWHPVTAGDFIYMAPYCPQWFCAVGKTPAHYIIYKDWNRHAD
jgi:(S)-ureidoglycine aminohydrolase